MADTEYEPNLIRDLIDQKQHEISPDNPYTMSDAYGGPGQTFYEMLEPPSGSEVNLNVELSPGVEGQIVYNGDSYEIENRDKVVIVVPPGAEKIQVGFFLNGVDFTPGSGSGSGSYNSMGSLIFTKVEVTDNVISGEILKFSVDNGVRSLVHAFAQQEEPECPDADVLVSSEYVNITRFPMYGETTSALSAKTGVMHKGSLILGTNQ